MSADGFLSRWSRRKLATVAAVAPSETPPRAAPGVPADLALAPPAEAGAGAGAADPAREASAGNRADSALPPLEELSLASDFSVFLKAEVGEALRRQALHTLFSDPHFNRMDGLDIYIDDYSQPDPIAPEAMARLRHAREWLRAAEPRELPAAQPDDEAQAAAAPEPAASGAADATASAAGDDVPQASG